MAYYVCSGAKLRCSMGSEESKLEVVHLEKPVLLCGKPMANIMDYKSMANIKPFGQCCSLANPVVAAATAANNGVLREMRCVPNPIFPWMPGKPNLLIKGQPALLDNCTCGCAWAGPIKITDAGQNTVYEGGPMTITITDPTVETLQSLEGMGGGDGVRGALGSGLLPAGFQPMGLPSLPSIAIPNLQPDLPQFPKIPQIPKPLSFIEKIKKAVETILQKITGVFQSGSDIRSSAVADSSAKANNSVSQAKKKEAKSVVKRIEVTGETEAFSGQEITYKATVFNNDDIVKNCSDVRWTIKVGGKELKKDDIEKDSDIRIEKDKITIKMKDDWIGDEIIVMPYLNSDSPKESKSVKTKIFPAEIIIIVGTEQFATTYGDATIDRKKLKIGMIKIFAHGYPNTLDFGLSGKNENIQKFTKNHIAQLKNESFTNTPIIYSYACRTGNADDRTIVNNPFYDYKYDKDWTTLVKPKESLAQKFSDHLNAKVYAYLRRTNYTPTWNEGKDEKYKKKYMTIEDENVTNPLYPPDWIRAYKTSWDEALWNENGAYSLPVSGNSPGGELPADLYVFEKDKEPRIAK